MRLFKKELQLHSLNISEVIDFEECGYLNARKLLFQNIIWKSTCWRVPNTAEIWTAALFYTFPLLLYKLSCATSLLVRSKILGLFFNTLTVDHMYNCQIWEKFPRQVEAQLSSKPITFFKIFIAFLKSTWNFAHFEKRVQLHSFNISEVVDSEECDYLNARKLLFQNALWKSTCWGVPNTAEISTAALL